MKSQWTQAGLEALRKGGVAGVRVERLAEDIGLTKGSFYWHFRGRGELLEALLEFWAREMTEAEFERISQVKGGLARRLATLAEDVLDKGGCHGHAVSEIRSQEFAGVGPNVTADNIRHR